MAQRLLWRTFFGVAGCVHLSFLGGAFAVEVDDTFHQDYSSLLFHCSISQEDFGIFFAPCFEKEDDQMSSLVLSS